LETPNSRAIARASPARRPRGLIDELAQKLCGNVAFAGRTRLIDDEIALHGTLYCKDVARSRKNDGATKILIKLGGETGIDLHNRSFPGK